MAFLMPTVGENKALEHLCNKTAPENLVLRLFQSNTTPAEGDTAATYTEATFSGYAGITLTGASWGAAASGTISYAQQTFTHDGGGTSNSIYGYYLQQATSTVLILAERDASAPFTMDTNGDNIKITPSISAD